MKIFVQVIPDSDHHKAIIELMARCAFKEIGWVVIGTEKTNVKVLLTYECDRTYFERYAVSFYVEVPKQPSPTEAMLEISPKQKYIFYSLGYLYGQACNNAEEFKKLVLSQKIKQFEVKHF